MSRIANYFFSYLFSPFVLVVLVVIFWQVLGTMDSYSLSIIVTIAVVAVLSFVWLGYCGYELLFEREKFQLEAEKVLTYFSKQVEMRGYDAHSAIDNTFDGIWSKLHSRVAFADWGASAVVLLGIFGTVLGLGEAIRHALDAMQAVNVDQQGTIKGIQLAMEPLGRAFYVSLCGIASGLALSLTLRMHEGHLENFVSELEGTTRNNVARDGEKDFDSNVHSQSKIEARQKALVNELKQICSKLDILDSRLNQKGDNGGSIVAVNKSLEDLSRKANFLIKEIGDAIKGQIESGMRDGVAKGTTEAVKAAAGEIHEATTELAELRNSVKTLGTEAKLEINGATVEAIRQLETAVSANKKLVEDISSKNEGFLEAQKDAFNEIHLRYQTLVTNAAAVETRTATAVGDISTLAGELTRSLQGWNGAGANVEGMAAKIEVAAGDFQTSVSKLEEVRTALVKIGTDISRLASLQAADNAELTHFITAVKERLAAVEKVQDQLQKQAHERQA